MFSIPQAAKPLIREFAGAFTRPTYARFVVLLLAAILTTGRRTISNLLRKGHTLAPGHPSTYHRVLSRRCWPTWPLTRPLTGYILGHWVPAGPVSLCGDDTVDEHRGKKVYGKACHRPVPVRLVLRGCIAVRAVACQADGARGVGIGSSGFLQHPDITMPLQNYPALPGPCCCTPSLPRHKPAERAKVELR